MVELFFISSFFPGSLLGKGAEGFRKQKGVYTVVYAAGRGGGNFFLLTDGRAGERDFSAFRLANPPSCFFENSLKSEFTSGERTRKHSSFPIWKLAVRLYFYTSAGCCCTE